MQWFDRAAAGRTMRRAAFRLVALVVAGRLSVEVPDDALGTLDRETARLLALFAGRLVGLAFGGLVVFSMPTGLKLLLGSVVAIAAGANLVPWVVQFSVARWLDRREGEHVEDSGTPIGQVVDGRP